MIENMVPRGRIELPTPAFSGPRSTGELPRHGTSHRFYGKSRGCAKRKRRSREPSASIFRQRGRLMRGLVEFAHPVFFLQDFAGL